MPRKPVLKVWCLPPMAEDALQALHKDLVAAAVRIKDFKLKRENDLLVLFPADLMKYGLGSEILIEYGDIVDHWERKEGTREELSARLGHAVKKHCPHAFIQCEVVSGDGEQRSHWCSKTATQKDVERIYKAAVKKAPGLAEKVRSSCNCAANAIDQKGPCGTCNEEAANRYLVKQGAKVLALKDPAEFQIQADLYVAGAAD